VKILYIKVTMSVRLSVRVGSAWKLLPVTARSLWSVFEGGGRESPVKHGAGGPARAGRGRGDGRGRTGRGAGRATGRGGGQHGRGMTGRGGASTGGGGHGLCLCGQKLGSAWKILPVTARSLWSW
jgi:hypothetical protein